MKTSSQATYTNNAMHLVWPEQSASAHELSAQEPDECPALWEQRFDITQIDAILHILHQLTQGLPSFLRRWLLRRASRLPKLHGHFAPHYGTLSFHAEEGEVIGKTELWSRSENGEWVREW